MEKNRYMRRFVIVFVLAGALALPFPATFAQNRSGAATATASTNSQRGVDLITAAQMKDYLYFIASARGMEERIWRNCGRGND